jgi:hypothetical protein
MPNTGSSGERPMPTYLKPRRDVAICQRLRLAAIHLQKTQQLTYKQQQGVE